MPESVSNSSSTLSVAKYIAKEVYKNEKFLGFYRGYVLSTLLVSLNSGIWWSFYFFYQGNWGHSLYLCFLDDRTVAKIHRMDQLRR